VGGNSASVDYSSFVQVSGTGMVGTQSTTIAGDYWFGSRHQSYGTTTMTTVQLSGHDMGQLNPEVGTVPALPQAPPDGAGQPVQGLGGAGTPPVPVLMGSGPVGPGSSMGLVPAAARMSWARLAVQLANGEGSKPPTDLSGMASMPTRTGLGLSPGKVGLMAGGPVR
jgi:hypothetical protein